MSNLNDNQRRRLLSALEECRAGAEENRKDADRAFTSAGVILSELAEVRRALPRDEAVNEEAI